MSCFNPQDDDKADNGLVGDEEGWTFVTYKRLQKPHNQTPCPLQEKGTLSKQFKSYSQGERNKWSKETKKGISFE